MTCARLSNPIGRARLLRKPNIRQRVGASRDPASWLAEASGFAFVGDSRYTLGGQPAQGRLGFVASSRAPPATSFVIDLRSSPATTFAATNDGRSCEPRF